MVDGEGGVVEEVPPPVVQDVDVGVEVEDVVVLFVSAVGWGAEGGEEGEGGGVEVGGDVAVQGFG